MCVYRHISINQNIENYNIYLLNYIEHNIFVLLIKKLIINAPISLLLYGRALKINNVYEAVDYYNNICYNIQSNYENKCKHV